MNAGRGAGWRQPGDAGNWVVKSLPTNRTKARLMPIWGCCTASASLAQLQIEHRREGKLGTLTSDANLDECAQLGWSRALLGGAHRRASDAESALATVIHTAARSLGLHRKKLRPGFGGSLAARDPVWDGEGWGCDRVA